MWSFVLMWAAVGQIADVAQPAKGPAVQGPPKPVSYSRDLGQDVLITSPQDIVAEAVKDAESLPADMQPYLWYVWVPDWRNRAYAYAETSHVLNSVFSRITTIVRPKAVANGRLIRINFRDMASTPTDLAELLRLREKFVDRDSVFHIRKDTLLALRDATKQQITAETGPIELKIGEQWVPATLLKRADKTCTVNYLGKEYSVATTDVRPAVPTNAQLAGYLGDDILRLSELLFTRVPIMRLDEFTTFSFSSINGGLYYEAAGFDEDLQKTLLKFAGKDAADKVSQTLRDIREGRRDTSLSKSKSTTLVSRVTGRPRQTILFYGTNTPPTLGPQLIAITLDIAEDNLSPQSDPFRNMFDFKDYDGGEVIFVLPNGMLAYLVIDNKDKIIAAVPDRVAHDYTARGVRNDTATVRVFSGMSCAHCHDLQERNLGWQPVKNDVAKWLSRLGSPGDDLSAADRERADAVIASQFGKDINPAIELARLSFQTAAHEATGLRTSRETVNALADSYWGYWYDTIGPRQAARELGFNLTDKESLNFLLQIPTIGSKPGSIEDVIFSRLQGDEFITGVQWRTILPFVAERLAATDLRAKYLLKEEEK